MTLPRSMYYVPSESNRLVEITDFRSLVRPITVFAETPRGYLVGFIPDDKWTVGMKDLFDSLPVARQRAIERTQKVAVELASLRSQFSNTHLAYIDAFINMAEEARRNWTPGLNEGVVADDDGLEMNE